MAALVAQGSGYSEADKSVVLDEHVRLVNEVIPIHRAMQEDGQIEVTMTPFAHPILPLLVDTDLAPAGDARYHPAQRAVSLGTRRRSPG